MNMNPIICAAVALVLAVAGCTAGGGQQRSDLAEDLHHFAPNWFKNYWQAYLRTPFPDRFALARDGSRAGYLYGSIRELYVFVIECLERQEVGLWRARVSRCGFRRRAG